MRSPSCSTAICAEPSTWPAGWKVTRTPLRSIASPILRRLRRAGEILAVAQRHDVERLARRQHLAMAGARMVGMAVRDQRALDRPHRIDEEVAGRAAKPLRAGLKQVARAHAGKIVICRRRERLLNEAADSAMSRIEF